MTIQRSFTMTSHPFWHGTDSQVLEDRAIAMEDLLFRQIIKINVFLELVNDFPKVSICLPPPYTSWRTARSIMSSPTILCMRPCLGYRDCWICLG